MSSSLSSRVRLDFLVALFLLSISLCPTAVAATDGWSLLERARTELKSSSPLEAQFTQTFLPSGFSSGDTESGSLYLDLPRCLRWEYGEPFPKNFLLCGDWVYTWNPDEPSGRRFLVEEDEAAGLELLRLDVDRLKTAYVATVLSATETRVVVHLQPLDPDSEISEAKLELAGNGSGNQTAGRLLAVEYQDPSGSRTRFELSNYSSLAEETAFEPPSDLQWLED